MNDDPQTTPYANGICTYGEDQAPGSGCIKPAGHDGAHCVVPGDTDAEPVPPVRYPHQDGDLTVLGPEIFTDGTVISWRGENFVRQTEPAVPVAAPPTEQAAVLRWAADELGRMDYDTDSNDYGYDTYRDAWNGGVMDGAELLRRLAAEAQQQPDTETLPPVTEYRLETRNGDTWMTLGAQRELDIARRIATEYLRGYPTAEMRILHCTRTAVVIERPGASVVSDPRVTDDEQEEADRIVAYRSSGARLLRCLRHAPSDLTGFTPVTSEDLPDGGTCTYPECGVDVLIPQEADRD